MPTDVGGRVVLRLVVWGLWVIALAAIPSPRAAGTVEGVRSYVESVDLLNKLSATSVQGNSQACRRCHAVVARKKRQRARRGTRLAWGLVYENVADEKAGFIEATMTTGFQAHAELIRSSCPKTNAAKTVD